MGHRQSILYRIATSTEILWQVFVALCWALIAFTWVHGSIFYQEWRYRRGTEAMEQVTEKERQGWIPIYITTSTTALVHSIQIKHDRRKGVTDAKE